MDGGDACAPRQARCGGTRRSRRRRCVPVPNAARGTSLSLRDLGATARVTRVLYVAADPALTFDQQGGAGTHMRGTVDALRERGLDIETVIGAPSTLEGAPTVAQRPAPKLRRV